MAAKLASGKYIPDHTVEVHVWRKPDAEGDGDPLYTDLVNPEGVTYGQDEKLDEQSRPIHHYSPPKGFINKQGYDLTSNYVLADANGRIKRNAQGHAYPIREGQALVIYPDGTFEHLEGDYAHTLFLQRHNKVEVGPVVEASA